MRDGLITAILNDLGTYPEISELFIILSNVSLNMGSACLRSFVGIGSSRHVDDLDERIREFSSGKSMGLFKCTSLISVPWGQSFQFSYSLF